MEADKNSRAISEPSRRRSIPPGLVRDPTGGERCAFCACLRRLLRRGELGSPPRRRAGSLMLPAPLLAGAAPRGKAEPGDGLGFKLLWTSDRRDELPVAAGNI